jgi:hypothetical protein
MIGLGSHAGDNSMPAITPATFYEWLMLVKQHRLKLGPLEGFKDSLVHHALGRYDKRSYGFWDHQSCTGFLNPETPEEIEVKPAPPVRADDPEWQ